MLGKSDVKGFKGFLLSQESVTVYSAIITTPIVTAFAGRFKINQIPTWAFLLVLAFILFTISGMFSGYTRAIALGSALGVFVNAIFASRFGGMLAGRLAGIQAQAGA